MTTIVVKSLIRPFCLHSEFLLDLMTHFDDNCRQMSLEGYLMRWKIRDLQEWTRYRWYTSLSDLARKNALKYDLEGQRTTIFRGIEPK